MIHLTPFTMQKAEDDPTTLGAHRLLHGWVNIHDLIYLMDGEKTYLNETF